MRALASVLMLVVVMGCGRAEEQRKKAEAEKALAIKKQAEAERARAIEDVAAQTKKIDDLIARNTELTKQIDAAVQSVADAQNDADRTAAVARLEELRKQNAQLQTEMSAAKAEGEKLERIKGVGISKECLDNPLAKGCS